MNCEVFGHCSLATTRITKTKPLLQVETKLTSMGAHINEHFLEIFDSTFKTLTETFSKVRIGIIESPLAVISIPIIIQTREFADLFVTLKIHKNLDKRENQSVDDLLKFMVTNLGALHKVSMINIPPTSLIQVGTIFCTSKT